MKLEAKVALVTGASVRLGQSIAIYLAEQGMRVAVHYHQSESGAKQTLSQMKDGSDQHLMVQADLKNFAELQALIPTVQEKLGDISVLINNAADFYPTPLFSVTEEQWDHFANLNLKAPFFLSQYAGELMLKQGSGKIINISDVSAERPWVGYLPYCTSKSGLLSLTKAFAKALAPKVTVNAIAPGTVLPPPKHSEIDQRHSIQQSLLKRMGSPEDIIQAVDYLLHADFVTGSIMAVDGGRAIV